MIDTHLHERALQEYELHMEDLRIYTNRSKEHEFGEYKFRQSHWATKRFVRDAQNGGFVLTVMKRAYDDAMQEVERLHEGIASLVSSFNSSTVKQQLKEMIE